MKLSTELLASALKQAEAAHAAHEKTTGQSDPDWPTFYADWLLKNTALGEQ